MIFKISFPIWNAFEFDETHVMHALLIFRRSAKILCSAKPPNTKNGLWPERSGIVEGVDRGGGRGWSGVREWERLGGFKSLYLFHVYFLWFIKKSFLNWHNIIIHLFCCCHCFLSPIWTIWTVWTDVLLDKMWKKVGDPELCHIH